MRDDPSPAHDDESRPLLSPNVTERDQDSNPGSKSDQLWWPVIQCCAIGSIIGTLVCLTNVHFGLQTGFMNIMQMQSILVGFGALKALSKDSMITGPHHIMVIQSVSSAIGAMPATAGLLGVVPALQHLTADKIQFHVGKLWLWSSGISLFGLLFAAILRNRFVSNDDLRFPTGTASATLIQVLNSSEKQENFSEHEHSSSSSTSPGSNHDTNDDESQMLAWTTSLRIIATAMGTSAAWTIVSYFLPILGNIPLFGPTASKKWLWTFNASLGYLGQGIITGPAALINMLAGAIVGWGILAPLAHHKGWAPGSIDDWHSGSRGWVLWVGLSVLLAETLVDFLGIIFQIIRPLIKPLTSVSGQESTQDPSGPEAKRWTRSTKWMPLGLLASVLCCVAAVKIAFQGAISTAIVVCSTLLSLPLCLMGIRALGTTDHLPASGIAKIAQLTIGLLIRRHDPHAIVMILIAGGIAESGVVQAGFMTQTFKTSHIVGADPTAQLAAMSFGTIFGGLIACLLYTLYDSVYQVPGPTFQAPQAFMWRAAARLAAGQALPDQVSQFALYFGVVFATLAVIRLFNSHRSWAKYIPAGVPFAIGMYLTPSFTLARVLGGGVAFYWTSVLERSHITLFICASGLILGEGLASMLNLILRALQIPHL